jgi:hypothetical protein
MKINNQSKQLTEQEMQVTPLPGEVSPETALREMRRLATKVSLAYDLQVLPIVDQHGQKK